MSPPCFGRFLRCQLRHAHVVLLRSNPKQEGILAAGSQQKTELASEVGRFFCPTQSFFVGKNMLEPTEWGSDPDALF